MHIGLYTYMNKQFPNLYTWSFTFGNSYNSFQLVYAGHAHIAYPLHTNLILWKLFVHYLHTLCLPCNLFIANHLYVHIVTTEFNLNIMNIQLYTYMLYVVKNRVSGQTVLNFLKIRTDLSLLLFISVFHSSTAKTVLF